MEDRQLHATPLKTPFGKIAMALSGGGFRASSFSIGAMSYLHQVQYDGDQRLLDRVEFISSASGGTFTAILYSAYTKKGLPFEKVYKDLLAFMKGETLLEEVLTLVNNDKKWENEEKSRNMINAFARIYDEKLFGGETFGVYWGAGGRNIEVCFNATEFYRGLSFRWQAGDQGMTGNNYIFFDKNTNTSLETLKKIKLGDIMASSSCFPAGFEPIVYPRDFSYPDRDKKGSELSPETLQQAMIITDYDNRQRALDTSIGLMDGGVDDNQGLYSAMLADQRRRRFDKENGFDLVIVTDVASYFMDPYVPPAAVVKGDLRKKNIADVIRGLNKDLSGLGRILKIGSIVALIMLAASIGLIVFSHHAPASNIGFLLLSPAILLLLIIAVIIGYKAGNPLISRLVGGFNASDTELAASLKEEVPAIGNFSDDSIRSLLKFFKGTRIGVLEQMVKARVNSMLSMVLDINLKQTRRLIFDIFFGNFYGEDVWGNRRVFNVIYEVSLLNITNREKTIRKKFGDLQEKYPLPPGAPANDNWAGNCAALLLEGCRQLNAVGEQARTMGTTLWYDHADAASDRMKKVVACGQFTTCAKLLEYSLVLERILQSESVLPVEQRTLQFGPADLAIFISVRAKLEADWKKFKGDPFWVYEAIGA